MAKQNKAILISASFLLALASFLFFGIKYYGHLHYMEQYHLFLFTGEYLLDNLSTPGGPADYAAKFLTQFFYYPWLGAAIIGIVLTAIQTLSYACAKNKTIFSFILSFIAPLACWASLMDTNLHFCLTISVLLSLAMLAAYRKHPNPALLPLLSVVAYYIAGPVGIIFILCAALNENPKFGIPALLIFVLCPIAGQFVFPYSAKTLAMGIHYWFYFFEPDPTAIAVSAICLAATAILSCNRIREIKFQYPAAAGGALLLIAGTLIFCSKLNERQEEEEYRYDYLTAREDWNGIIRLAEKNKPTSSLSESMLLLAQAKNGRLLDNLFEYKPQDPTCLIPYIEKHHFLPIPSAEIYFQTGLVNAAMSVYFDCQEAISSSEISGRCQKRLAECFAVDGRPEISERYLYNLRHSLFYRAWAKNFNINDDKYAAFRQLARKLDNFSFSAEKETVSFMKVFEASGLPIALEYSLASSLLSKNTKFFIENLANGRFTEFPKSCQQALLLMYIGDNIDTARPPAYADKLEFERYIRFMRDRRQNKSKKSMYGKYGNTFWFYFFYMNK